MRKAVHSACHSHFHPEVVALFDAISLRESFWMDLVSPHKERILKKRFQADDIVLNLDELETLAQVFAEVVDYRSAYTARHSIAVGATSRTIAMQLDLPMATQRLVGIAGYLHDIGKLCVSPNILEKPGTLTAEEYRIIRQHPYYTHQILSTIPGFEKIALWAAFHHERLDGKGYPFRPSYLPLEARIVAIADIFVALREDRPYRKGLEVDECLQVLHRFAQDGAIDGKIVDQMSVDTIPMPEEV